MSETETDMEKRFLIRAACEKDVDRMAEIYDAARRYMRAKGNHSQWSDGYPSAATARRDIAHGRGYVVEAEGNVVATFCLMTEAEPTYAALPDAMTEPYVTLHRVASDGSVAGVFSEAVAFALSHGVDVRVDTHADNAPMRAAIMREGFEPCGVITLADGSPRLAFRLRCSVASPDGGVEPHS